MQVSSIIAMHTRLDERLHSYQSWDYLADTATVSLLLLSGFQSAIEDAAAGGVTPQLMVASAAVQAAERDLQWVRERGSDATLIESHVRTKMAWHNLGHATLELRRIDSAAADVA